MSTILVHDANLGQDALDRGCVDLVLAGHLHVVVGPDAGRRHERPRSATGSRPGTTGGAAYAIAIGTKPRRDATVTLVTYRDGRPVGLQWVSLSPLGDFTVERLPALLARRRFSPDRSIAGSDPTDPHWIAGPTREPRSARGPGLGRGAEVAGFEPARGFSPQPA